MKQSIAWAVLLILVPCFAHAGGEGLYVGAHADFQRYEIDESEIDFDDDDAGLSFGVYAGFGKEVGNGFYAAFEVEGNTGGNKVGEDGFVCIATGANTTLQIRREGSLGAHVLLGKAIPAGRLYLKAGRVRTKFNAKDSGCPGLFRGDGYENGNSLGIGYDYDLNEQWSVRGEYSHIGYESDGGDDDILRLGVVFRL